jgi:lysyl-tRNA synthetase class 2
MKKVEILKKRADFMKKIRLFFERNSVLEIETPILSDFGVTDVNLDMFETEFVFSSKREKKYLLTSPEYHMKRLLAEGSGDIFQITRAFRNNEEGRRHNPEFSILEWYRINFSMENLMNEVTELIQFLGIEKIPEQKSYSELFQKYLNFDPISAKIEDLKQISGQNFNEKDEFLDFLFVSEIEPKLSEFEAIFVHSYPKSQAALAKLDEKNPELAKRFELYLNGIEICNGFEELTDYDEQKQRFDEDNRLRKKIGKKEIPIDSRFLTALKLGMPNSSGVAVGIDRLFMAKENIQNIEDVLAFPFKKA